MEKHLEEILGSATVPGHILVETFNGILRAISGQVSGELPKEIL